MRIGPFQIEPALVLAPMAGVTDLPFRRLCRRMGAGLAVSEMTSSDPRLWHTTKSRLRLEHAGEPAPVAVQIAGDDPAQLAAAARHCVDHGAQIIDINMGCPAKKVCRRDAGSALLRDEPRVAAILQAVVAAVDVPVTLKIRTGYTRAERNAVRIARIAEDVGIVALAVHGRTREDHFEGAAEFETVAAVKQSVQIPVLANGDIVDAASARRVLQMTGADGLMIGRGALGRPWLFGEIDRALRGDDAPRIDDESPRDVLLEHLDALYAFYGELQGVRVARKHIRWYCHEHPGAEAFWRVVREMDAPTAQRSCVATFLAGRPLTLAV